MALQMGNEGYNYLTNPYLKNMLKVVGNNNKLFLPNGGFSWRFHPMVERIRKKSPTKQTKEISEILTKGSPPQNTQTSIRLPCF